MNYETAAQIYSAFALLIGGGGALLASLVGVAWWAIHQAYD